MPRAALHAYDPQHEAAAAEVASVGAARANGLLGASVWLLPELPALTVELLPAEMAARVDEARAQAGALAAGGAVCAITGAPAAEVALVDVPVFRLEKFLRRVVLLGWATVAAPIATGACGRGEHLARLSFFSPFSSALSLFRLLTFPSSPLFHNTTPPPPAATRAAKRPDLLHTPEGREAAAVLVAEINRWGVADARGHFGAAEAMRCAVVALCLLGKLFAAAYSVAALRPRACVWSHPYRANPPSRSSLLCPCSYPAF